MNKLELCRGVNCPVKKQCKRYMTVDTSLKYLPYTPYNHRLNKCESFIKH